MFRTVKNKLISWKNSADRKPLILKGARQTGKTFSLLEFGEENFSRSHYINFQETPEACSIFNDNIHPDKIIQMIEFFLDTNIDIKNDFLFLDEIQDCPRALTSLKYFCEHKREFAVAGAGSLVGVTHLDAPFPVGKVNFLHLYPLSFEEFLLAKGDSKGYEYLNQISTKDTIPRFIHESLIENLKEYYIVGGLPEVINIYCQNIENKKSAFDLVRTKQKELVIGYLSDFSKYSGKVASNQIVSVFESIPATLSLENKKFVASKVIPGSRFSSLRSPIDWLVNAGLIIKVKICNAGEIPFEAFTSDNKFKLYCFDIGILGAISKLSPNVIYLENNLYKTFKGAFCENFVAQEMLYSGMEKLYSWSSNTAEIEFLKEIGGDVIPIEVKSGLSGKLKSLKSFADKYHSPYRVRISARNLEINQQAKMHSYPLYLASKFPQ